MPVDPNRESWKPGMDWQHAIDDITYIKGLAREMGGPERVERQHKGGRYTIRERIDRLVDPGTFIEAGPLVGAATYDEDGNLKEFTPGGYVMGVAEIDGLEVHEHVRRDHREQRVAVAVHHLRPFRPLKPADLRTHQPPRRKLLPQPRPEDRGLQDRVEEHPDLLDALRKGREQGSGTR